MSQSSQEGDDQILSQKEVESIILALAHGQRGFTESDMLLAIKWAIDQRIAESCLNLVLSGKIALTVVDGDIEMTLPDVMRDKLKAGASREPIA